MAPATSVFPQKRRRAVHSLPLLRAAPASFSACPFRGRGQRNQLRTGNHGGTPSPLCDPLEMATTGWSLSGTVLVGNGLFVTVVQDVVYLGFILQLISPQRCCRNARTDRSSSARRSRACPILISNSCRPMQDSRKT